MYRAFAPAKVNLSLRILGRRPDGYHELITRMQKVAVGDWIDIEVTDDPRISLSCSDETLDCGGSNLAAQAASLFFKAWAPSGKSGARLHLRKTIPVAAGLGGGSSDGAAVLTGLNHLCGEPFSETELKAIGAGLGADSAFFITGCSAAVARGIGDEIRPVRAVDGYRYALVTPGIEVSTRWVYDNYRLTIPDDESRISGFQNDAETVFSVSDLVNDLERVTAGRYPIIGQIKRTLLQAGAVGVLMSGSGPTVFGLFPTAEEERDLARRLDRYFPATAGYRVFATRAYTGA